MAAMQINNAQFRQWMEQGETVLVDYWAPWCGYCRRIGPAYDQIAEEYGGRVAVVKVNIDEEPRLTEEEGVEVIPTLILYKNGKEVNRVVAPKSKAAIDQFLREGL